MPKVRFARADFVLEVEPGASLLEAAQAADAPHDFGCTVGNCGVCACLVTEGAETLEPPDEAERETLARVTDHPDARLACRLVVHGDITLVQPIE